MSQTKQVDAPGRLIAGRYRLLQEIGKGGMGSVWRGEVAANGTPVAIKRITIDDHKFEELFCEEARVNSGIRHQNVVQAIDFGRDDDGRLYLVLEFVDGVDLMEWIRFYITRGIPAPWPIAVHIVAALLRGLHAAHNFTSPSGERTTVLHRDLSPANIRLSSQGYVKLIDFGVARAGDRATLTPPNFLRGKLGYSAPELLNGARASVPSDIFGAGVVLWECLAGQRALFAGSLGEAIERCRTRDIKPLSEIRPLLDPQIVRVVNKAIEMDPKDRWQGALVFHDVLLRAAGAKARDVQPRALAQTVEQVRAWLDEEHNKPRPPPLPPKRR